MARKHFQRGSLFQRGKSNKVWVARWWEDVIDSGGEQTRVRRSEILGFVKDLTKRSQAEQILTKRLRAVNAHDYPLKSMRRFSDFVREDWQPVVLPTMKYATQRSYESCCVFTCCPHLEICHWVRSRARRFKLS